MQTIVLLFSGTDPDNTVSGEELYAAALAYYDELPDLKTLGDPESVVNWSNSGKHRRASTVKPFDVSLRIGRTKPRTHIQTSLSAEDGFQVRIDFGITGSIRRARRILSRLYVSGAPGHKSVAKLHSDEARDDVVLSLRSALAFGFEARFRQRMSDLVMEQRGGPQIIDREVDVWFNYYPWLPNLQDPRFRDLSRELRIGLGLEKKFRREWSGLIHQKLVPEERR